MTAPHLQLFTDVMSGSGTAVAVMGPPSRTSIPRFIGAAFVAILAATIAAVA